MKTSNLAERLEEFEAVLESLRLTSEPSTRLMVAMDSPRVEPPKSKLRAASRRRLLTRSSGYAPFRVF